MCHIFEFGVPEGLRSMEAHMKALASVGEGSESVLRGRRILELVVEEDEANSVVFPGGVLQEDTSVNESSSSSWQWPWAASGEINMWNPLLCAMADVVAGPVLDDMVRSGYGQGGFDLPLLLRCALLGDAPASCFLAAGAQFGCADMVLEFRILRLIRLLRSGSGGKRSGDMDGYFSTIGGWILNSEVEVCTLGLGHLSEVVFHWRLLGGSFSGMGQGGSIPGTVEFGQWTCSNCGKPDCWSTRYSCYRCGCPRYFDGAGVGQVHSIGQGKGGGVAGFHGQGVGGGMSGVRLVGALGRDQTYVSIHTGKAMVGEEEPVRGRCLVQRLVLALEGLGGGSKRCWKRMVYLRTKVELGWRL